MKKKLKKHITFCFHGEKCWEKKVLYIYIYIYHKQKFTTVSLYFQINLQFHTWADYNMYPL